MSDTLRQLEELNGTLGEALPTGAQDVIEEVVEAAPAPEPEAAFEVDGQKFADEKTAFEYLKKRNTELEAASMVEAARIETMQEMMRQNQGVITPQLHQQVEANPEMDLDDFYANPVEYLAKERQKIKSEVLNEVTSQQTQAQRNEQVWNDFSNRHPDLADMRDIVDLVASQNHEIVAAMAGRNPEKAYDFVATKVREKFQGFVEAQKPTRQLSQSSVGPSPGGNQVVTTQGQNPSNNKPLDFISQVKQHRNR